jgi:Holliday junction DNA helicase RuvA
MIVRITGKLVEKREQSVVLDVHGLCYEVIVPVSVLSRMEETKDLNGNVHLITYHYFQISPASGTPLLIGFINEVERDFFLQFIKVSGIGPRAAVKALGKPICEITRAIDEGDIKYLTTLPGIGAQRAKEVVAKLQGKVGRFGLIQDKRAVPEAKRAVPSWQEEALEVLLQLQYKKNEASDMIHKALENTKEIRTTEDLLNEIYKQKVKG